MESLLSPLGTGFTFVLGLVVLNYFGILDKFKPKNGDNTEVLKKHMEDLFTQRISGYDSELLKGFKKLHEETNTKLEITNNKLGEINGKVERLIGKVDARFESDDGYHEAIVVNQKENTHDIKDIDKRLTVVEQQYKPKKQLQNI